MTETERENHKRENNRKHKQESRRRQHEAEQVRASCHIASESTYHTRMLWHTNIKKVLAHLI